MRAFFQLEICHCSALARFLSVLPVSSAMICVVSLASRMENCGLRPSSWASWRTMRTPIAWKVHTVSPFTTARPSAR